MPYKLPTMTPCDSSAIGAHGYDPAAQVLYLTFKTGNTYAYPEVGVDVYAGLKDAPSVGRYYGSTIKGKYIGLPVPKPAATDDGAAVETEGGAPD